VSAAEQLLALAQEVRSHRGCGFEPCESCSAPVPGEGPADAEVMLVGEAPGRSEDQAGRPFCGKAGRLLDELLESVGLRRGEVYVTNVVKARPPSNRDPTPDEVFHCWPWLKREAEVVRPRVIMPLGRFALHCFLPGVPLSQAHGRPARRLGWTYLPLYHPAAAGRSTTLRETAFADMARLPGALAAAPPPPPELVIAPG
jgi:uracil-DNA glycosylase family 4